MHIIATLENILDEKNTVEQVEAENTRNIQRLEEKHTKEEVRHALNFALNAKDQDFPAHLRELILEFKSQDTLKKQHYALMKTFWDFIEYADLIPGMRTREEYQHVKVKWSESGQS